MKCARYRSRRCHPEADGVHSRRSHVNGITEPLSATGPTQIEAAASIGSGLQVHTIWTIAVPCTVDGVHTVARALSAEVVILCLDCAWYRRRHSAEGSPREIRECGVIDIPAAIVFIQGQHLLACWQRDVRCHCRPGLPASCRRNVDSPAEIGSRRTRQMKCAGYRSWRCHPEADGVHSRGSHVDGITEPLPGTGPAQIEAASCVGRCFQINAIGTIAIPRAVD